MGSRAKLSLLPSELISNILGHLIPNPNPLVLRQSHSTTETLLSLARTCRATHTDAIRLLYTYCVHVDNIDRLHMLSTSLSYMAGRSPSHLFDTPLTNLEFGTYTMSKMSAEDFFTITAHPPTPRFPSLPNIAPHQYITSIQIELQMSFTPELISFAHSLYNLISLLSPTLRHLFIDVPLDYLYRDRSQDMYGSMSQSIKNMRLGLRSAFLGLQSVETLWTGEQGLSINCARDEPYTNWKDQPVYFGWPNLKCFVLATPIFVNDFLWRGLAKLPSLEVVVLVQPRRLVQKAVKEAWEIYHKADTLSIYAVRVEGISGNIIGKDEWANGDVVVIKEVEVPIADGSSINISRNWVKDQLLSGRFPKNWKVVPEE